jgi:hypothetical protein
LERNIEEARNENNLLGDKLQMVEQEKVNLINEKERRERDCKNMQIELNRINSMVHVIIKLSIIQCYRYSRIREVALISNSVRHSRFLHSQQSHHHSSTNHKMKLTIPVPKFLGYLNKTHSSSNSSPCKKDKL